MKRVLSCLLICAMLGCVALALASCSLNFNSSKSTEKAPATTAASETTDGTQASGDATTFPAETEVQPTEPEQTTAPATTEEGLPIGEDPDDNFGPLHPFN